MKRILLLAVVFAASFATAQTSPFLTYSNIDQQLFSTCGSCGNSGGSGTQADYLQSIVSSITLDGRDSEFYLDAPSGSYGNGYWYNKHWDVPSTLPTLIRYSFSLYIPSQYSSAMHAIEFATGMRWSDSYMYRFAWQMNFGSKMWRVYDPYLKQWVNTGIALSGIKFGAWNTIVVEGAPNTSSKTTKNLALTVNGVRKTTLVTTHARKESSSRHYFVNAFQLDSDRAGDPYAVYVDKMNVALYSGTAAPTATATTSGVTMTSPTNGSTVSNPVQVNATARSSVAISYMSLWIDGVKNAQVSGSTLSKSVTLSTGSHRIVVQAKDASGTYYKDVNYVTVK